MAPTSCIQTTPEACSPGNWVLRAKVADWPRMSGKSVIAFRRFVGSKRNEDYELVRKGTRIFTLDTGTDYAKCIYNHTREF